MLLKLFLPFAFGYFLSFLYRVVNVVIAPDLVQEFGLNANQMGFISSIYLLTFALCQLPLGLLLDRYESRKVSAALLLLAALGALVFSCADSAIGLLIGRGLIGIGVSACLMAAFTAYANLLPSQKLPLVNGLQLMAGGLGVVSASTPVQWFLTWGDWRLLFQALAIASVLSSILVYTLVPKYNIRSQGLNLGQQLFQLWQVVKSPRFYQLAPLSVATQGVFGAFVGLWSGYWLRDYLALSETEAAQVILTMALAMTAGFVVLGWLAANLQRFGISAYVVSVSGMVVYIVSQWVIIQELSQWHHLWWSVSGFFGTSGVLMYAYLSQAVPKGLVGRVNTSLNLCVFVVAFACQWGLGVVVNLWPADAQGVYPQSAYATAWLWGLGLQLLALAWLLYNTISSNNNAHQAETR
ncbi:MAG: MFS transporter [Gammaproteobacteria bacterium]|nr:MFS transporter [Gammaproteobacteria bacterium]